ncbi:ABC transporter ATP-binding protein [Niastella vici]|uniref:ABC transporter ATP-binding protein n=1 Tax=Niastella vici TaxID=1703345 RepID=A0A1V9FS27_9BACT|nr:ABC transporter ATP-binding protein [Niastella vici]OQP61091.1 ABC transporter ATP-binding protein [Niastella vici]
MNTGLWRFVKPYWHLIGMLIVLMLAANAMSLWIPAIVSQAIDAYGKGGFHAGAVILKFSVAAVAIVVLACVQGAVQALFSERVARDLRRKLSDNIAHQSYEWMEDTDPDRLLTHLTIDVDAIKTFISQAVFTIASAIFVVISCSVIMLFINWQLALCVMAMVFAIGIANFTMLHKIKILSRGSREIIDRLNKVISENITGAALIRLVHAGHEEQGKFIKANEKAKGLGLATVNLLSKFMPVTPFATNIAALTILVLGGYFVITGNMSLGNFAAFNSYLSMLVIPVLQIASMSGVIAGATTSYERIKNILEAPPPAEAGTLEGPLQGAIGLEKIQVAYGPTTVLKNISLSIKAGSRTAIIGPTGAGKTKLLYLLTGLIRPQTGSLKFDGVDIEKYCAASFQSQLGFVFQDSIIFNMTIRDNIAFSACVTAQSLEKAIATAELKDLIDSFPNGLDTVISERGTTLSGGQKQRLMLARALVINPKILLLDDFTARVDKNTEQKILCNIERNYPELTLVSVTQKISSVKHYDQIVLLMEGELLAMGTHEQLMRVSPEYVQFFFSQENVDNYELRPEQAG